MIFVVLLVASFNCPLAHFVFFFAVLQAASFSWGVLPPLAHSAIFVVLQAASFSWCTLRPLAHAVVL